MHRELMRLARRDSAGKLTLGSLAARFIDLRGYERLGFARLGDYSAERLGWSARQVQEVARISAALSKLPAIHRAFERAELGWSKVRLLASLATPHDEEDWLAIARQVDVRELAAVTSSARAAAKSSEALGWARRICTWNPKTTTSRNGFYSA